MNVKLNTKAISFPCYCSC